METSTLSESKFAIRDYCVQMCADLHIGGSTHRAPPADRQIQDPSTNILDQLEHQGYFVDSTAPAAQQVPKLARYDETLRSHNIAPVWAFIFDEFWDVFLDTDDLLVTILGSDYQRMPAFWAWHVDATSASSGWTAHRDNPDACGNNRRKPDALTVWIPLTDATPENGCIYLIPADKDPGAGIRGGGNLRIELATIRALPANAGSTLCWTQDLLHWGASSSSLATMPRISLSVEFQRGDKPPIAKTVSDPLQRPSFDERVELIQAQLRRYKHMYDPARARRVFVIADKDESGTAKLPPPLVAPQISIHSALQCQAYASALAGVGISGSVVADNNTAGGMGAMLAQGLGAQRILRISSIDDRRLLGLPPGRTQAVDWIDTLQLSSMSNVKQLADVIVSDPPSLLPFVGQYLTELISRREQLLSPNGIMIPSHSRIRSAVVEMPEVHDALWGFGQVETWSGINLAELQLRATNAPMTIHRAIDKDEMLTALANWTELNYSTVKSPNVASNVDFVFDKAGTAHGIALWCETALLDSADLDSSMEDALSPACVVLPFSQPVAVNPQDTATISVQADFVATDYLWQWNSTFRFADTDNPDVRFNQSTFFSSPPLPTQFKPAST